MKITLTLFASLIISSLSAQWTNSGSDLYTFDRVGIQTTTPQAELHVFDSGSTFSDIVLFENTGGLPIDDNLLFLKLHSSSDDASRFVQADIGGTVMFEIFATGDVATSGGLTIGSQTPTGSAGGLRIENSERINLYGGETQFIQWYDNAGTTVESVVGNSSNGDLFLRSNIDDVIIDGESQLRFQINNSLAMIVDSNGNLGIGDSSPSCALQVAGNVDISGELTTSSDLQLKKNINPIEGSLSLIDQLYPVSYQFRTEEYPDMKLTKGVKRGLIAQDVEKILPDLVSVNNQITNSEGQNIDIKSINYIEIIPLLVDAIQELSDLNEAQNLRIAQLTVQLEKLNQLSQKE